jgi:hypothetical protein
MHMLLRLPFPLTEELLSNSQAFIWPDCRHYCWYLLGSPEQAARPDGAVWAAPSTSGRAIHGPGHAPLRRWHAGPHGRQPPGCSRAALVPGFQAKDSTENTSGLFRELLACIGGCMAGLTELAVRKPWHCGTPSY